MLGMTPNHLSAIERGASGISLEALQRLCRLLGVSADRIIFGTDAPEAEALALARRISDINFICNLINAATSFAIIFLG